MFGMIKGFNNVLLCGLFLTIGCCLRKNASDNPRQTLIGNYYAYNAALGSGKGIVFNVPIPDSIKNKYTIDSLYIQGKSIGFSSTTKEGKLSIEANVFINNPSESISIDSNKIINNRIDTAVANIIIKHQFQPAYLLVHSNKRKYQIMIKSFNELVPESNY